jgi:uncharacterized protein (UPF0332 family)
VKKRKIISRRRRRDWKGLEDLLDDEYFEESARTSYYSMYHAAKALLVLRDSRPKTHRGS